MFRSKSHTGQYRIFTTEIEPASQVGRKVIYDYLEGWEEGVRLVNEVHTKRKLKEHWMHFATSLDTHTTCLATTLVLLLLPLPHFLYSLTNLFPLYILYLIILLITHRPHHFIYLCFSHEPISAICRTWNISPGIHFFVPFSFCI